MIILFKLITYLTYYCVCLIGFDLSSAYDVVIPRRGRAIVKTDLSIAIPPETYARIGNVLISYFTFVYLMSFFS